MMYPTFGACVGQGVARCVLSPHDCSQLEVYRPAKSLDGSCSSPTDVDTGRCTGSTDQFKCAATEDSCSLPLEFDSSGGTGDKDPPYSQSLLTCNLQYGTGTSDGYTLFPMCQEKNGAGNLTPSLCVLFKEDCNMSTEDLILPSEENDHYLCKCHNVPVGVCYPPALGVEEITQENSYCAVGAWDCRDDHISYLSSQAASKLPNIKCRLCPDAGPNPLSPEKAPYEVQPSQVTDEAAPAQPNDATPAQPRVKPLPESSAEAFAEDLIERPQQILSMVALVLGTAVGMFALMIGVSAVYRRRKNINHVENSTTTFKGQLEEQSDSFELDITNAYDA